jgi:hypothetical protein
MSHIAEEENIGEKDKSIPVEVAYEELVGVHAKNTSGA